jgi:hypothetical protein
MIVDFTSNVIAQGPMSREEAEALVAAARGRILALFPGREETYELIYAPRFRRLVDEFAARSEGHAVVVPFRPRTPR